MSILQTSRLQFVRDRQLIIELNGRNRWVALFNLIEYKNNHSPIGHILSTAHYSLPLSLFSSNINKLLTTKLQKIRWSCRCNEDLFCVNFRHKWIWHRILHGHGQMDERNRGIHRMVCMAQLLKHDDFIFFLSLISQFNC